MLYIFFLCSVFGTSLKLTVTVIQRMYFIFFDRIMERGSYCLVENYLNCSSRRSHFSLQYGRIVVQCYYVKLKSWSHLASEL